MQPSDTKLFLLLLLTSLISGCASSAPPLPPSLDLPVPVTDLRALRKGDRVYLAWTVPTQTTDRQAVRHLGPTLICRSTSAITECGVGISEVAPPPEKSSAASPKNRGPVAKVTATFVDQIPSAKGTPNSTADELSYAVEVLNADRRSAGLSNQVAVPALPAVPPPSTFQAEITGDGVRIGWSCISRPGSQDIQYRLRIYRRLEGSDVDSRIAEPDLATSPSQGQQPQTVNDRTFNDQTFEWEKSYEYRAAPVMIISEAGKSPIEIEGDDTATVKVIAHDVFPPAVPAGVQAVFSGPGQAAFIDLIWSPDTEADLAGYNVFRREQNSEPVKLNSELIKVPAYRDNQVQAGKRYIYTVSAVDVRGNESAKSAEAMEAVP